MAREVDGPFKGFEVVSINEEMGEVVIAIDPVFFKNGRLEGAMIGQFRNVLDKYEHLQSIIFEARE